jgi:hypothetical protein
LPRNNQRRTKSAAKKESLEAQKAPMGSVLDFVTPTEFVDLPSQGKFYPEDHPFHNKDTIEIRYMTAKDEDILTNKTLLRKGIALEKLLENILSNSDVDPGTLLIGDRNAIIVAARTTGYGPIYDTSVSCPSCQANIRHKFNLANAKINNGNIEGNNNITKTDEGTFIVKLPLTKVNAEVRLLTGEDELELSKNAKQDNNSIFENVYTSQLQRIIVSLNEEDDRNIINRFVELMPAHDSRHLRNAHAEATPNIDLTQDFVCSNCGHEQEMEVPFTVDFFWPNR